MAALVQPQVLVGRVAHQAVAGVPAPVSRHAALQKAATRQQQQRRRASRRPVQATASTVEQGSSSGGTDTLQGRRVVVAVDASEHSLTAFDWVLRNLLRPGDEVHLLHVVPDIFQSPASGSIYYCSSPDPETERALWQQVKQFFVDHFLERAKAVGLEDACWLHLVKESRHKHIGRAVCRKAEELGAEPLVVAAHDKGPLETLFVGSVSKYCVAHSKRPVLLLHPNHSQL